MKLVVLFTFLSLMASNSFAQEFCDRSRSTIADLLIQPEHRIDFKNRGGLFGGGVCWWHARLQRSSLYLARYNPSAPKPNAAQVRQIILALKNMNRVVTIPGYENFNTFTQENQKSVQTILEGWQREDGILNFEWMRGISGRYQLPARELEVKMKKLYHFFEQSPLPVWIMAQMKGITSHSYLIRHMVSLPSGFEMEVIDSNKPKEIRIVRYQFGDVDLHAEGSKAKFIPYTGFQEDFTRIARSLANYCKDKTINMMESDLMGSGTIPMGEIEPNLSKKKKPNHLRRTSPPASR